MPSGDSGPWGSTGPDVGMIELDPSLPRMIPARRDEHDAATEANRGPHRAVPRARIGSLCHSLSRRPAWTLPRRGVATTRASPP